MDFSFLMSLNGPIDCIHPGKEHRHRRQELFFQKGDLSFPVGVIHPGPGDQHPFGGVGGEDPFDCPVAGLHQTNGISRGITESLGSHNQTDAFRRTDGTQPSFRVQAVGAVQVVSKEPSSPSTWIDIRCHGGESFLPGAACDRHWGECRPAWASPCLDVVRSEPASAGDFDDRERRAPESHRPLPESRGHRESAAPRSRLEYQRWVVIRSSSASGRKRTARIIPGPTGYELHPRRWLPLGFEDGPSTSDPAPHPTPYPWEAIRCGPPRQGFPRGPSPGPDALAGEAVAARRWVWQP